MKLRNIILLLLLLTTVVPAFSQTQPDKKKIKKERLSKVEMFHYAIGFESSFNTNVYFSPEVMYGVGSFRNLINADIGLRYMFGNPFFSDKNERLVDHQIPFFISVQLNFVSWKESCAFIGAEMAYCMPVTVFHHYGESDNVVADRKIGKNHFSSRAKIGVKLNRVGIMAFYEFDLAPMMNQKYVYESAEFDYDALHASLFERTRFGVSLTYYFNVNL